MSFHKQQMRNYLMDHAHTVSPTFASLHLNSSLTVDVNATVTGDLTTNGVLKLATGGSGGLKIGNDVFITRSAAGSIYVGSTAGAFDGNVKTAGLEVNTVNASTNTISRSSSLYRRVSGGGGAVGLGTGMAFPMDNDANALIDAGAIDCTWDDATAGSEDGRLSFKLASAGVLTEALNISPTGGFQFSSVGISPAMGSNLSTASNNDVSYIGLELTRTVSGGVGANGFGLRAIAVTLENDAGSAAERGNLQYYFTDATGGSEDCACKIQLSRAGTLTDALTIDSSGNATFAGTLTWSGTPTVISSTNLLVADKLITLNDGGAAASGGGTGLEVEEDNLITAYFKQAAARTGWELTSSAAPTRVLTIVTPTGSSESLTMTGSLNVEADSAINQDLTTDADPTFDSLIVDDNTASAFLYSAADKKVQSTAAPTDGQLLIGSTGVIPVVAGLTGTADQITVTPGAGSITLSTPQSINTTSSPVFVSPRGSTSVIAGTASATNGTVQIQNSGSAFAVKITAPTAGADRDVIFPDAAGTVVLTASSPALASPTVTTLTATGAIQGLVQTQLDIINATADTGALIVEDCEAGDAAAWTESANTKWDISDDAAIYKVGTGSLRFTCSGTAADNDVCYLPTASLVWTDIDRVGFWVRSSIDLAGGDVLLYCYDGAGGTTVNELSLGALTAGVWTYIAADISGFVKGDIDRVGFSLSAAGAAKAFYINVDNIAAWDETYTTALTQVPLLGGWRGCWQFGDQAADNHTSTAVVENVDFVQDYSATKKFIPLTDYSAKVLFLNYCYD